MTATELSAIILYDHKNRILLQHRTNDAPTFPGYWSFFGGGVEPGETPEQAAVRETLEELSYALKMPQHWMSQHFVHDGRTYTQHIFLERYNGSELVLGEGQAMKWFAARETGTLLMNAHSRAAVEALGWWFAQHEAPTWKATERRAPSMRILKEILVLAVIVLVFAYAARQLEGIDAGELETGVPPLSKTLEQLFGWDEDPREARPKRP